MNDMKSFSDNLLEFMEIYHYIDDMQDKLLYHSNMDRDEVFKILYNKAFSDEINGRLQQILPFTWCDIDGGYDDDFLDWKNALDDIAEEVQIMLEN